MPKWSNNPPPQTRITTLPIRRCPPKGHLSGWFTSLKMVGCEVHWYKNRTYPCESANCPACKNEVPSRWKGYAAAWILGEDLHVLLEFPVPVAETFGRYVGTHGTLRGAMFELRRIPQKVNGKVHAKLRPDPSETLHLPPVPNLIQMLAVLWDIQVLPGNDPSNTWTPTNITANSDPGDEDAELPPPNN